MLVYIYPIIPLIIRLGLFTSCTRVWLASTRLAIIMKIISLRQIWYDINIQMLKVLLNLYNNFQYISRFIYPFVSIKTLKQDNNEVGVPIY